MNMVDIEKRRESRRRWREKNPEKNREYAQRWREKNPEYRRQWSLDNADKIQAQRLRQRHGLQLDQKIELLAEQGNCCYLCGDELTVEEAVVDHDHRCHPDAGFSCEVCRRGLACGSCNHLVGHGGDSPERLRRIASNLEAAMAEVTIRLSLEGAS